MKYKTILIKLLLFYFFSSLAVYSNSFQIENVSLNQKILDHINDINEIPISFNYPDKKYATISFDKKNKNLEIYESIHLSFEWKDDQQLIQAIYGFKEIKNFEHCLKKQNLVLNEIYSNFTNDVKNVIDGKEKSTNYGKYDSDLILLNNGDIIKVQCYDSKNDPTVKWGNAPRFSFTIGLNSKKFDDWLSTEALKINEDNKLKDFEIENFTINESLLKHIPKSKIETFKKFKMNHNKKLYSIRYLDNLELYNELAISMKYNDNKYNIVGLRAAKYFGRKDKCINEKDELFNYLLKSLNNISDRALRLPTQNKTNSQNENTKVTTDYFTYINGNEINITCVEQHTGNLFEVGFYTREFRNLN